jgi:hypothetical protein
MEQKKIYPRTENDGPITQSGQSAFPTRMKALVQIQLGPRRYQSKYTTDMCRDKQSGFESQSLSLGGGS